MNFCIQRILKSSALEQIYLFWLAACVCDTIVIGRTALTGSGFEIGIVVDLFDDMTKN